jgi:hypothetical protein
LISPLGCIEAPLDQVPNYIMEGFVLRAIQHEHGKLDVPSSNDETSCADWPPLSTLGRALVATDRGKSLVKDTETRAEGNLAWARLRLDDISKAETIEDTLLRKDRLPRNLVALFDSGVSEIENQRKDIARLGLKAILLASLGLQAFPSTINDDPEEWFEEEGVERDDAKEGVPFVTLRNWIHAHDREARPIPPTLKEVLHAARGYLKVEPEEDCRLAVYHTDFGLYVRERYNARLVQELEVMQSSSFHYLDR